MVTDKEALEFFSGPEGRPVKRRELARALGVTDRDYPAFRALIRDLIRSGRLVKLKRGRLAPPDPLNLIVGEVSLRRSGFAFVAVEDRPDLKTVFVPARLTGSALDGDRVMVRLLPQSTGPTPALMRLPRSPGNAARRCPRRGEFHGRGRAGGDLAPEPGSGRGRPGAWSRPAWR